MLRTATLAAILPLALLHPGLIIAQEAELVYDDDSPGGPLTNLTIDDIEVTRMTAEHPSEVLALHLHFASGGCSAHIFVWGDNGGNAPNVDQVLFEAVLDVDSEGWGEVEVPAGALTIDPPWHFYVGHQLEGEPPCQVSWDGSGSEEARSLVRIDGGWSVVADGGRYIDAMIRARVRYLSVLDERYFEDTTDEAGLPAGMNRMAWGDYDNDGDDDLLTEGGYLFRNNGDGTFLDITDEAGVGGRSTNGGVWADYDNDGHLDFYATVNSYHPECEGGEEDCRWCTFQDNPDGTSTCIEYHEQECVEGRCLPPSGERAHDLLWRNNGDGTFTDVTEESGAFDFLPSEAAAWADYDHDGFVDLYVANYEVHTGWVEGRRGVGTRDFLWRNNGDGTFSDVTDAVGLRPFVTDYCGRGAAWADYDLDGDIDLYVANYRLNFNFFWENNGDGTFGHIGFENGTAGFPINGAYGHSIGPIWGDVDRDGDWDLFVANLAHPRFLDFSDLSMLYINGGGPDFEFLDHRATSGIGYSETHSDPAFGDFDNDGLIDIFITDIYVGYRSFLYRNNGDITFSDVTYPAGIEVDNGWGAAWADYDNDGRLDLVSRTLWRNKTPEVGHWLTVRLRGTTSNASAIGAMVTITAGGVSQIRQVEGGKGTGIQSSMTLHFGLGAAEVVDDLVIRWPSGLEEIYHDVPVDTNVSYREGDELLGEPDGGTDGGADGGADGGDGGAGDGDGGSTDAVDGGCSCHVVPSPAISSRLFILFTLFTLFSVLAFLELRRRSRRRRQERSYVVHK